MCGISGSVTTRAGNDLMSLIERIVDDQRPRGPDARRVERFREPGFDLLLGHNRLSIIDLDEKANQPFSDADGILIVSFNGEIYNYLELRAELEAAGRAFRTRSDTEVLVQAFAHWGVAAFDRLMGMFAFALFDRAEQMLYLVRDRFGVKPLFYWASCDTLVFASSSSEIADWAALKPNLEYVARGLRLKYYEDETAISPFGGLHALEPAHYLRVSLRSSQIAPEKRRFYDLRTRVDAMADDLAAATEAEREQKLIELLTQACRIRLRADVEVGISLSGGVDSSSIAAIVSRMRSGVRGYSFASPDDPASEGPLVAHVGRATSIDAHYIWPSADELDDLFWKTLDAQRAPFPHSSIMAQFAVFERARRDGVTVLLGGQGGDEAFMGYRKFFLFHLQDLIRSGRLSALPGFALNALAVAPSIAARAGVFWSERKRYSGGAGMGLRIVLPELNGSSSPAFARDQDVRERQTLDVLKFSLPSLLRYEDRNSMANSIESRLPFMDHRVVEFGLALPASAKLRNGYGKFILRSAMKDRIPDSIRLSRDKRGFDTRQDAWIRGGLGRTLRAALAADESSVRCFLPTGGSIASLFSDEALARHPQAFKEAVSLIWLANPTARRRQAA